MAFSSWGSRMLLATLAGVVVLAASVDIQSINQAGTGRVVLNDYYAKTMQDLADFQSGSTVHRFDPQALFQRVLSSTQFFSGLMSVSLVIAEPDRQTRSQHASTIEEVAPGVLMAAWFGGTWERMGDVGIWTARYENGDWGQSTQVAWPLPSEKYPGWQAPCWNPVLKHIPEQNTTFLFFKVGIKPSTWQGYVMRSYDLGLTWGPPRKMGDTIIGPVKNAPLVLSNGTILSPSSDEQGEWTSHVEVSHDGGWTWYRQPDLHYKRGIIQPAMFKTKDGNIRMLMRTRKEQTVASTVSTTGGSSWEEVSNINSRAPNSGLDAIALHDGRVVVVHNTEAGRKHLVISMSYDNGETYEQVATLERDFEEYTRRDECFKPHDPNDRDTAEYSYPFLMQSDFDGMVHITYTYSYYGSGDRCTGRENIKHVVVDPCQLGDPLKAHTQCMTRQLRQTPETTDEAEEWNSDPSKGYCSFQDCNGEPVAQGWCRESVQNCLGCKGVWCPEGALAEEVEPISTSPSTVSKSVQSDHPESSAGNAPEDISESAIEAEARISPVNHSVSRSAVAAPSTGAQENPSDEIEAVAAIGSALAVSPGPMESGAFVGGVDTEISGHTVSVPKSTEDVLSSMSFAVDAKPATATLVLACLALVLL